MNAILHQLPTENIQTHNVAWLRSAVSSQMLEHASQYKSYADETTYEVQCKELINNGTWNIELMDILPLAVANIFQTEIKIISSVADEGVMEFNPSFSIKPLLPVENIVLSHYGIPGREHYDTVIPTSPQANNTQASALSFDDESDMYAMLVDAVDVVEGKGKDNENINVEEWLTSTIMNQIPGQQSLVSAIAESRNTPSLQIVPDEGPDSHAILDVPEEHTLVSDIDKSGNIPPIQIVFDETDNCLIVDIPDEQTVVSDVGELGSTPPIHSVFVETDSRPIVDISTDTEILIENVISNNQQASESVFQDISNLGDGLDDTFRKCTKSKFPQPDSWKKNIRKRARNLGQEYTRSTGEVAPAHKVRDAKCACRFKCESSISEDQRQAIFKEYWETDSQERQRDFITSTVNEDTATCGMR